jgi:hypothetical protein
MKQNLFIFFMLLLCSIGFAQKVAVIGLNHSDPDGFSFVVVQDLAVNEVIYFTENEYNNATGSFTDSNEAVVKYTASAAVAKGNVIYVVETGTTTNAFTVSCTNGSNCGSAVRVNTGPFAIGQGGESFYAYSDSDDNPINGLTTIHAVLYTGFAEGGNTIVGGDIVSSQDPRIGTVNFPNAIVVDGFPSSAVVGYSHHRAEFNTTALARTNVTKVVLENVSNYQYTGSTGAVTQQALSTQFFTNLNLVSSNPVATVSASPSSVNENSGTGMVYTFSLSANAAANTTINFTVGGTAILSTDYNQTGAASFSSSAGTVVIPSGSNSATVTVTPIGDTDLEPNETVILTITAGTGYDGGSPGAATGTIVNDDTVVMDSMVAVTGISHTDPDAISFVALQDIPANSIFYFTDHSFDATTLRFSTFAPEVTVQWTSPGTIIPKGHVIVLTETGTSTNTLNVTCSNGSCGSVTSVVGDFALASAGETFYAYRDNDADPTNGFTHIDSALFTGTSSVSGGTIPAIEDPRSVYTRAIVVSGFPASAPLRTEYDATKRAISVTEAVFESTSNWVHAQSPAALSTVPFSNLNVLCGTPPTPTFTQVDPICAGATLSALPTTSTNGINGTWAPALNNMATTEYTFTPNMGECGTTTTMTITVNPILTPTFTQVDPICAGDSLAALPTTSSNSINGTWAPALNNMATTEYTFTPNMGECGTTTTMTIVVNAPITPSFTQVDPICEGATLSALPTTSNNSINGTWAPAINNMATTEYTFTPNMGECGTITTMTIVVNTPTTPTFTAVAAICSGETLSALPTGSNNGINGTWSPALNNMVTTTYTFTPDVGQCANSTTLQIVVNPLPSFSINAPSAACEGDTLVLTSTAVASANNFAGPYAVANWAFSNTNADGSVNTSLAPNSIAITGGNNGSNSLGNSDFTITIPAATTLSFNWAYTTTDGAQFDFPQVIVNGSATIFTGYSTSGSTSQSGTMSVTLNAGDTFAFNIRTVDNFFGAATVVISNFATTGLNLLWTATDGGTILGVNDQSSVSVTTSGTYTLTATLGSCSAPQAVVAVFHAIPAAPTASSQNLAFGATVAQLVAAGNNLAWYDVETGGTSLDLSTPLATGTYYVSQTTNGCESPRTAVSVVVGDPILTTVRPNQCGLMLAANNATNLINAIVVPGASSYDFEVTVDGTAPQVITNATASFNFGQLNVLPGLSRIISIRVRATIGGVQQPYGTSCNVFTRTQITQVRFTQCGITVTGNNGSIVVNAIPVVGATSYDFEVMRNGGNTEVITTPSAFFTFSQLSTLPASSTILSIRVRATVNTIVGAYGNSCNIFTATPITSIRASQCGITVPANNGSIVINANPVTGASNYQFGVIVNGGAEQLINTANSFFNFSQLSALPGAGSTISVRVRATVNTIVADWSASCNVFTPGDMDEEFVEMTTVLQATAYPNPFFSQFTLKLANNTEASIQVFDITGKLISDQVVNAIYEIELGQNLETGVYLVRIEQNGDIQNIKMVKK